MRKRTVLQKRRERSESNGGNTVRLTNEVSVAQLCFKIRRLKMNDEKCVIVVDENLPLGIIANTAAILGITLGARLPGVVGADVRDGGGNGHMGIIEFPVPILKATSEALKKLRLTLYEKEYSDLTAADFTDIAQSSKTYDEFIDKIGTAEELRYFGIAICGAKKKVNRLTGSLPLLR